MNFLEDDTRTVVVEREMAHSVEKVWRALTQGPLLEEWLMKNDFQPVVGHRFSFRATPVPGWSGVVDCEVLEVEPKQRLAYTWGSGLDNAETGVRTVVTWTLTPTKTGVLLRMEQSGFRIDEERAFRGAQYGWQKYFVRLESVTAGLE